jgi:hypothetical protein
MRPYLEKKKPFTKRGWWSDSSVGLEFKPQYYRKKKKRLYS